MPARRPRAHQPTHTNAEHTRRTSVVDPIRSTFSSALMPDGDTCASFDDRLLVSASRSKRRTDVPAAGGRDDAGGGANVAAGVVVGGGAAPPVPVEIGRANTPLHASYASRKRSRSAMASSIAWYSGRTGVSLRFPPRTSFRRGLRGGSAPAAAAASPPSAAALRRAMMAAMVGVISGDAVPAAPPAFSASSAALRRAITAAIVGVICGAGLAAVGSGVACAATGATAGLPFGTAATPSACLRREICDVAVGRRWPCCRST